ncbi:hypothetical protein Tco_1451972, partial [Tanacetum coccineum]
FSSKVQVVLASKGGTYIGRGGFSSKGRGSFNGRGGFSNVQVNDGKRYVPVKNMAKGKTSDMEGMKKQEVDKETRKDQTTQVKHIAQNNFSLNNRFSALTDEEQDDKLNEWQGIKINIDVGYDMRVLIDEEESVKWPQDLQEYYKTKCDAENKVVEEMEKSGSSRNQAFDLVYSAAYSREFERIKKLDEFAVLLSSSDQVMHFEVKLLHDKRRFFFISFIYGENKPRDRLKLWDNLSVADVYKGVREFRSCIDQLDMEGLSYDDMFLPDVTCDHCPYLLVITDVTKKKRRAFRFMNYLMEKKEFHKLVNDKWNEPIQGYAMFVLVKRLKNMKRHLRDLIKKNRNVHESAYKEAALDEEIGRKNRSRIIYVQDDMGNEFYDEEVAERFVDHFQSFLGNSE